MINAIKLMDDLEKTGFTQEQAKTSVNTWLELMNDNFATKTDLKEVETSLRHDMKTMEMALRHDMKSMEIILRKEISDLDLKIDNKLISLENRLTIKLGGMLLVAISAMKFIFNN